MKFRVIIAPDEDGVFVAECPALSGCVSQGKTREEAMANIRDAIQGYLRSLEKHGEPIPGPVTEEIIEVPVSAGSPPAVVWTRFEPSARSVTRSITKPAVT